ncbi:MAG: type II toxin-antitoxin system Phd/YefM family antitoxin [Chloroflexota bacterium]|nr:type II toxin-antitoxin system Phd/YefM family antitoxin [Chloroflexota bacterium]
MKTTKISATDLRIQTRDIIERARFKGERFVVQTFGKPVVVILGLEAYYSLQQLAKNGKVEPEEKLLLRSARQKPPR